MPNDTSSSGHNAVTPPQVDETSVEAIPGSLRSAIADEGMSDGAFRMYAMLMLMNLAGQETNRRSLAADLAVSTRTIYARELELVGRGRLKIIPRRTAGGADLSHEYVLVEADAR